MAKRVIVIASGETERRALPLILNHLQEDDVWLEEVRIPPGGHTLTSGTAERIARAAWFEKKGTETAPDKIVILVDTNGASIEEALKPFEVLKSRLEALPVTLCFAAAKRHLEAWFFADEQGLRRYLGRDLGEIDASAPDEIPNPKNHLRNLLQNQLYTARVAEEIALKIDPAVMGGRSPSFASFVRAVRNGSDPSSR